MAKFQIKVGQEFDVSDAPTDPKVSSVTIHVTVDGSESKSKKETSFNAWKSITTIVVVVVVLLFFSTIAYAMISGDASPIQALSQKLLGWVDQLIKAVVASKKE